MKLLESDPHLRIYGKGHTIYEDYFFRNPVVTLERLQSLGINCCATLRRDARDQPKDKAEIRATVKTYKPGEF